VGKCRQWIREFVWLANRHVVVLDIVQTNKPEIRRQWQMHVMSRPDLGDRSLTLTNRPPEHRWADPALKPESPEGRLFCQTVFPRQYKLILHDAGKAEAFDPTSKSLGPVEGNAYHRKYGQTVVQIEPGNASTQTVFLHVLTAVETEQLAPPKVTYRVSEQGTMELIVDGATTSFVVPEWLSPTG
jgi:hypothetical protein